MRKKLKRIVLICLLVATCCCLGACEFFNLDVLTCDHKYVDKHPYYKIVTEPTETTAGLAVYTCTECGYLKVDVLPATGETPPSVDPPVNPPVDPPANPQVTLVFVSNGQTVETQQFDGTLAPPTVENGNMLFEGWFLDENYTTPLVGSNLEGLDGTFYVYAKWAEPPVDPTDTLVANFVDRNLSTDNENVTFTTTGTAFGYEPTLGVQFSQLFGDVELTSHQTFDGVNAVRVVVSTSCTQGMEVFVSVGGMSFVCLDSNIDSQAENLELVFVGAMPTNGQVVVTMSPNSYNKNMYISLVEINPEGAVLPTPNNVMPTQNYNALTFDNSDLQYQMENFVGGTYEGGYIGLPSTGTYNALVVPVQFSGYVYTQSQLNNLELAFNGTEQQTGWNSVATYYKTSSYGKLNLSFDIAPVYTAKYSHTRYKYSDDGAEDILLEVLSALNSSVNFQNYDSNNDGMIDAVYLIYSAPVDYDDEYSNYWAYVTTTMTNKTYDNLYPYYYLFAGYDFVLEDIDAPNTVERYGILDGLKINASTFIHETGHLLGLDDYYDYNPDQGSDEGLGTADMMDSTVGDHSAYSKIMLGWIEPTVVTSTQTFEIGNLGETGQCLLVPLNFNNSYFSEYLLVDLYSATGLNQLHSNVENSFLYDGAKFGVRIYHVTNWLSNPYSDDYYSFTDYNNSVSEFALIKLVEADGTTNYSDSLYEGYGYAMADDLWQKGDNLLASFNTYSRNDGKVVNFNIIVNNATSQSASITVWFAN